MSREAETDKVECTVIEESPKAYQLQDKANPERKDWYPKSQISFDRRNINTGDALMACEKCQGLKPGDSLVRLGEIIVVSVRREPLNRMTADAAYGRAEAIREGFPEMSGGQFVDMFCKHMKCLPAQIVTRIEFRHANAYVHVRVLWCKLRYGHEPTTWQCIDRCKRCGRTITHED